MGRARVRCALVGSGIAATCLAAALVAAVPAEATDGHARSVATATVRWSFDPADRTDRSVACAYDPDGPALSRRSKPNVVYLAEVVQLEEDLWEWIRNRVRSAVHGNPLDHHVAQSVGDH